MTRDKHKPIPQSGENSKIDNYGLKFYEPTVMTFGASSEPFSVGCLRQALVYFGGMPEHVLFDNSGAIIMERDAYGQGHQRWHSGLLAVAEEFGFTPRVCQPYRAKTKGKVGRFNGYIGRLSIDRD